jgi:hypothetical protein
MNTPTKQLGIPVVFGIQTPKPIINLPPDTKRVKIRMRNDCTATAFVRTADGVRKFLIGPANRDFKSDGWELILEQGRNVTT